MIVETCEHVYDELSFIWCVLYCYFVREDLEEAIMQASSMYERNLVLSSEFEEMLLKLWESGSRHEIFELARKVVEKNLFSTTNHIILIAFLVDSGQLSVNNASKLLQVSLDSSEGVLSDSIGHVLDVAWLTNEDEKDVVMSPDADDILLNALKEVKVSVLSNN